MKTKVRGWAICNEGQESGGGVTLADVAPSVRQLFSLFLSLPQLSFAALPACQVTWGWSDHCSRCRLKIDFHLNIYGASYAQKSDLCRAEKSVNHQGTQITLGGLPSRFELQFWWREKWLSDQKLYGNVRACKSLFLFFAHSTFVWDLEFWDGEWAGRWDLQILRHPAARQLHQSRGENHPSILFATFMVSEWQFKEYLML